MTWSRALRFYGSSRPLGSSISMDDFGTGYSSLANLRSFPFDKIKIDKSFVGELDRDEDSAAIVRAVLALGASLGMKTCAEGVETWPQLEHLRTEGCDEVQGYLYSKPKSATETRSMLDRGVRAKTSLHASFLQGGGEPTVRVSDPYEASATATIVQTMPRTHGAHASLFSAPGRMRGQFQELRRADFASMSSERVGT